MRKILLIPLLFVCFFVKAQTPVNVSQPQKFLKYILVNGSIKTDSAMAASDSSTRVPNTKWAKQNFAPITGGGYVSSVLGTANRITSTGGTAPVINISSTFEALLGKVANPLSQFAATTSAQFLGVITDETGSGLVVGNNSPTFITPTLGVASATSLNVTGTGGAGYINFAVNTLSVPTPSAGVNLYSFNNNGFAFRNTTGNAAIFLNATATGDRQYQFPNSNGTIALNPLTTTGDIIYSSGTTTAARRAIGAAGYMLGVVGGVPDWINYDTAIRDLTNKTFPTTPTANGMPLRWEELQTINTSLSGKIGGSGTINYLSEFTGSGAVGNSKIYRQSSSIFSVSGDDYVNGSLAMTSSGARFGVSDNIVLSSGAGHHGFGDYSNITQSATNAAYANFDAKAVMSGSSAFNHFIGFQSRPEYAGSGALTYMSAYDGQPIHSGSGTIADYYGMWIRRLSGSGPVSQYKALYIEDPTGRGTSSFAIYTSGGNHLFGGPVFTPTTTAYATGGYDFKVLNQTTKMEEIVSTIPIGALSSYTISGNNLGTNLPALSFGTHLTAGGSSYNGTGSVTITSDATSNKTASTLVERDASGISNFEKVGIGTNSPVSLLDVTVNQAKTLASNIFYGYIGKTNESSNYAGLQMYMAGGASQAVRKWTLQTVEASVANDGILALQPSGGSVTVPTPVGSSDATTKAYVDALATIKLASFYTDQTATTTPADVNSYTLPANSLTTNGQYIEAEYYPLYTGGAGSGSTTIVYFGGQTIYTSGAFLGTGIATITYKLIRTGTTTARCIISHVDTSLSTIVTVLDLTGIDFTTTNVIKANIVTTASNTLVLKGADILIYK